MSIAADCLDLDHSFADWLVPRLRHLACDTDCYPEEVGSLENWQRLLHRMADGFAPVAVGHELSLAEGVALDEALDLFRKHFRDLWL
jgi:hypothetical protein